MKLKRFFACFFVFICLLGLTACSNNSGNSSDKTSENTSSIHDYADIPLTSNDIAYYYESYVLIQDFYKGFYYMSDAIEDSDKDLFNVYLNMMKESQKGINDMEVSDRYAAAHEYLVNSIQEYVDGVQKLYNSYEQSDVKMYEEANDMLANAQSTLDAYVTLIYVDFETIATLLNSFLQNEYYFDMIDLYEYSEDFSDNENDVLFYMERHLKRIAYLKNDLILAVVEKKPYKTEKQALENISKELKELSIENTHLKNYRDEVVKYLDSYVDIVIEFAEMLDSKYDNDKVKEFITKSDNLNYSIFKAFGEVSEFYKDYDIDVGFDAKLEESENLMNSLENGSLTNQ